MLPIFRNTWLNHLLQETKQSWIQYMNSCHQYRISKYSGFRCTGVISHTQENTLESIYQ